MHRVLASSLRKAIVLCGILLWPGLFYPVPQSAIAAADWLTVEEQKIVEETRKHLAETGAELCDSSGALFQFESTGDRVWQLQPSASQDEVAPNQDRFLVRLQCSGGAIHQWFIAESDGPPISISFPKLLVKTVHDERGNPIDTVIRETATTDRIFNSDFDPETNVISEGPRWSKRHRPLRQWKLIGNEVRVLFYAVEHEHDDQERILTVYDAANDLSGAGPIVEPWPPVEQKEIIDPVRALHERITKDECFPPYYPVQDEELGDRVWKLPKQTNSSQGGTLNETDDLVQYVVRLFCLKFNANVHQRWYLVTRDEVIVPLQFAYPVLDAELYGNKPWLDAEPPEQAQIVGFRADPNAHRSYFDPETQTIVGHVFNHAQPMFYGTGRWKLDLLRTVLQQYEIDASMDGETNPVVVYDASATKPFKLKADPRSMEE